MLQLCAPVLATTSTGVSNTHYGEGACVLPVFASSQSGLPQLPCFADVQEDE